MPSITVGGNSAVSVAPEPDQGERWLPIPGLAHLYEVSTAGRVRSVLHEVRCKGRDPKVFPSRILQPNDRGRVGITLGRRQLRVRPGDLLQAALLTAALDLSGSISTAALKRAICTTLICAAHLRRASTRAASFTTNESAHYGGPLLPPE